DLVDLLDEDRALLPQTVDDELVVHDLVAPVDGLVGVLEGPFDGDHSPVDARAEAARFGKQDSSASHGSNVGDHRRRRQGRAGSLTNPPQPPPVPARPVGQWTVVGACQSVPMIQTPPEPGAGAEPPRRTLAATAAQTTAE